MMSDNDVDPRTELLAHLRRATDLTVQLSGQLQTRAQVIASTNSFLLAIVGALISSKSGVFDRIVSNDLTCWAWVAVGLVGLSTLLVLGAALPRRFEYTTPEWFRGSLADPEALAPLKREMLGEGFGEVLQNLALAEVGAYSRLADANRVRGRLIVGGQACVAIAILIATGMTIDILNCSR